MAEVAREIKCGLCGAPIRAEDMHLDLGIARCSSCNAVVDLALRQAVTRDARQKRAPVPLPEKFEVTQDGSALTIGWRWFGVKYLLAAFFCVAWDGFLVFWYAVVAREGSAPWIVILFPIAHVAVGVGLTYTTLAGFLNRTRIVADGAYLRIRHYPLPWRGNSETPIESIEQLFTREKISHSSDDHSSRTTSTFEVHAILKPERRRLLLLSGLEDVQQALWIEQALEQRLGIVDVPVEGEVPRDAARG